MQKVPFNSSIFHYALIGLFGRTANTSVCDPDHGYYSYIFAPTDNNKKEIEELESNTNITMIKKWLDIFEIIFSETSVDYGLEKDTKHHGVKVLVIRVQYPVEAKVTSN